jgi:hypothetical protein
MTTEPGKDFGLALAEARRRLDSQLSLVDASRGRATGLLGVGGLLGTFVGGLGAINKDPGATTMTHALWIAAGAFGLAVAVGLAILAPWKFGGPMSATQLVSWVEDHQASREQMERDLAIFIDRKVDENARKAAALQTGLLVIVLALGVEFAALAYQLRSS